MQDTETAPAEASSARPTARRMLRRAGGVVVTGVEALVAALVTVWAAPADTGRRRSIRLPFGGHAELVPLRDLVMTLALFGLAAADLQNRNTAAGMPYTNEYTLLFAALSTVPLLLRTRWPLAAWRGALAGSLVASVGLQPLLEFPLVPSAIAVHVLCLYTVALRTHRDVELGAWLASLIALVGVELLLVTPEGSFLPGRVALGAGVAAAPVIFGHNLRERREMQAQMVDERRRSGQERAVLEERSRIARELHDVVAHHMSVIAIQAEAAPLRTPGLPSAAAEDFGEIRRTALQAMTEMRHILGILRQDDEQPDAAPQPGIDRLVELTDSAASAGLDVTLTLRGTRRPIPAAVGVSAYRIVQESLSNVMRHAPGATVTVEVTYVATPPAVRLRVENGPPARHPVAPPLGDAGHGLLGMRERAVMLGGDLTARATEVGGFLVTALLPLEHP